jgi:hypothetical protein
MSHPTKKRGFRVISLGGSTFRWRFSPGAAHSRLTLQGNKSSGRPLDVILVGWRDPWLAICGFREAEGQLVLYTAARNEPEVITPRFVREAIMHGLANGWLPDERGPRLHCAYREGMFSPLSQDRQTLTAGSAEPAIGPDEPARVLVHAQQVR